MLYKRTIKNPPEKIVQNGKADFGDFNYPPRWLSVQHLKQPFSLIPLPNFITKTRIRTNLSFSFVFDDYDGSIEIIDGIYFYFVEIILLEKETKRKLSYRSLALKLHTIPVTAQKGTVRCSKKDRYILIKWDYAKNLFSIACRLKQDKVRPSFDFAFTAPLSKEQSGTLVSVVPSPTKRRCSATHTIALSLTGNIAARSPVLLANPFVKEGLGVFTIRRAFYSLRTVSESVVMQGFVADKKIQLAIYTSSQDSADSDLFNENVLFVDNDVTTIPPVTITHSRGLKKKWIIQDTENMVDLTFTPSNYSNRINSILVLRTDYTFLLGTCEGTICDNDGTLIPVKSMPAAVKKIYLRM